MMKRHFTASVYVVKDDKVLLVHHKKLNLWLPLGGHIEEDETPEMALEREAMEEAGISIEILGERDKMAKDGKVDVLLTPNHMLLEDIDEKHQHIDLVYLARTKDDDIKLKEDEHHDIKWFSAEEIPTLITTQNVKHFGVKSIREMSA